MKVLKFAPILLLVAFLSSCSKEESIDAGSGGNNPASGSGIQGNWKFIAASGSTNVIVIMSMGTDVTKAETEAKFISEKPVGTYSFTGTSMKAKGIGYDYNGEVISTMYQNNVLQMIDTMPMLMPIPQMNSEGSYKLVGNDSIYFSSNVSGIPSAPGSPTSPAANGCKYKLEGNRLSLFLKSYSSHAENQSGTDINTSMKADITIVLEKI